jgi:TIR domain
VGTQRARKTFADRGHKVSETRCLKRNPACGVTYPERLMTKTFAAFMSYVRMDDQHENRRLTELCSRLAGEVRMQLGQEFLIFQDRNDISWGEQWKQRIDGTIDATTFLIPIITPSFFKSSACRGEVERFLERQYQRCVCHLRRVQSERPRRRKPRVKAKAWQRQY